MSTAAREQGSLHAAVRARATAAGASAPLLLLVEDIHWADAWTLERLAALALLAARQPLAAGHDDALRRRPDGRRLAHRAAWRAADRHRPRALERRGRAPPGDRRRLRCRRRSSPAASSAPKATRSSCCSSCSTPARPRSRSLPGSIQALVHARMDRLARDDKLALQAAAVLGQRFAARCAAPSARQPGLRLPAPGRALPRPPRRQRVHVLPRAHPRRRLRVAAAQAAARCCTAAPPSGSSRATSCSPPSTSTAPRIRARRRPTWRRATRSRRSSAMRRRWR